MAARIAPRLSARGRALANNSKDTMSSPRLRRSAIIQNSGLGSVAGSEKTFSEREITDSCNAGCIFAIRTPIADSSISTAGLVSVYPLLDSLDPLSPIIGLPITGRIIERMRSIAFSIPGSSRA